MADGLPLSDWVRGHADIGDPAVAAFVKHCQDRFQDHLLGVIFYGSCLRAESPPADAVRDFFVLVDRYADCQVPPLHLLLSHLLPPNAYYMELSGEEDETYRTKYSLCSMRLFERQTSLRASDTYLFGRMGQKVAIVYAKNQEVERRIQRSLGLAVCTVVHCVLPLLPERFTSEDCVKRYLLWSYASEPRPEGPDRIMRIYHRDRPFYDEVYGSALKELAAHRPFIRYDEQSELFECKLRSHYRKIRLLGLRILRQKSRVRQLLRMLKWALLFDNWVDYVVAKLERHTGMEIRVTPKIRRHPFLFGWPEFLRVLRAKVLR